MTVTSVSVLPLLDFTEMVFKLRKRKIDDDMGSLELVLQPPSVAVKRPRLASTSPCLYVDQFNGVSGTVNGTKTYVVLDSGATFPVIYYNEAMRLGLITGREPTTPRQVAL